MSLLLVTADGADQLRVTRPQLDVCRLLLSLPDEELDALRVLLQMGPERWRALMDVADSELALERMVEPPRTLPFAVNGVVRFPILCQKRESARLAGDHQPTCTWTPDGCGFTCSQCARWLGAETSTGELLAQCFSRTTEGPIPPDGE